jgi:hypothetical protein
MEQKSKEAGERYLGCEADLGRNVPDPIEELPGIVGKR